MDFFDLLVSAETDLWNEVERGLSRADQVGLGTLMALRILHRYGTDGRVQDVSADLSITVGAASKLVDRLERDHLAVRRPHPDDRRSSLVALTPAGDRARVAGEHVAQRVLVDVLGDEEDIPALIAALARLRERITSTHERVPA